MPKVTVLHGISKHVLEVDCGVDCSEVTLEDLARAVAARTGVPISNQKLIHKGQTLKDLEQTLSSCGVKEGAKLMLVGSQNNAGEEEMQHKLEELEGGVEKLSLRLSDIRQELDGIENGFLEESLKPSALSKLSRRVKGQMEQFVKLLEQELPEGRTNLRVKRKNVVRKIQTTKSLLSVDESGISLRPTGTVFKQPSIIWTGLPSLLPLTSTHPGNSSKLSLEKCDSIEHDLAVQREKLSSYSLTLPD
uniref:BAG family molecular chaperone regulator 1-like isoform X2 n=1 Tax=Myxine glutinosa TaxID=7769 RepID=UPI00358FFFFE